MAKLPPETSEIINQLRQQLLDIIHDATATSDILELLERTIIRTQNRIFPLERSVEEIKLEWNLS